LHQLIAETGEVCNGELFELDWIRHLFPFLISLAALYISLDAEFGLAVRNSSIGTFRSS
jgi:hypothetical protein